MPPGEVVGCLYVCMSGVCDMVGVLFSCVKKRHCVPNLCVCVSSPIYIYIFHQLFDLPTAVTYFYLYIYICLCVMFL